MSGIFKPGDPRGIPPDGFYWYTPNDEREERTIVKLQGEDVWFFGNELDWTVWELDGTFERVAEPKG